MSEITTELQAHITELEDDAMEREVELRKCRAQLAGIRETLFGGLDCDRDGITTPRLAVAAMTTLAWTQERAKFAESDLASAQKQLAIAQDGLTTAYMAGAESVRGRLHAFGTPTVEDGDGPAQDGRDG